MALTYRLVKGSPLTNLEVDNNFSWLDDNKQAKHANLTMLAALPAAADKLPFFASNTAMATTDIKAFGKTLLATAVVADAKTALGYTKVDIGLGNVDNTADANKPVSTQQTAAIASAISTRLSPADVINNLLSTETQKPLAAAQGKALYDMIQANNVSILRYSYVATSNQTVFSGPDAAGKTLSYVPGVPMIVTLNGDNIELPGDYTATDGTTITLTDPAELGANLTVVVFGAFTVANSYTKAESDSILNSRIASLALKSASKADIVGAVSQVGDVPTGAIIEYTPAGSIAGTQGDCTRLADGTQICTLTVTGATAMSSGNGALFNSAALGSGIKWAKAFKTGTVPKCSAPLVRLSTGFCVGTPVSVEPTATDIPIFFMFTTTSNTGTNYSYSIIAVGRWY